MFKLHVVQAAFGDCLLLEFGTAARPRFILIDGGPPNTYDWHLRSVLEQVAASVDTLDFVILSHVDNDHVIGLLDFFADKRAGTAPALEVKDVWHNAFSDAIDAGGEIEPRMRMLMQAAQAVNLANTDFALLGIGEGHKLRQLALQIGAPLNDAFGGALICTDDAPASLEIANLTLKVVGPTRANLNELREQWLGWIERNEDALANDDMAFLANSDRSIPNLSSIMLLAEAHGRTLLLTGDGRSDHLLQGLEAAGLLDAEGNMHVDVLKVAHHGSDRNATKKFFRRVTADTYVISADGTHDNPDLATLIWIVETAQDAGRPIRLLVTNHTPSVGKLLEEYDPAEYGYTLEAMPAGEHSMVLELG